MNNDKCKACPFCGSGQVDLVTGVMHEGWKFWRAYCINCQMRTEPIKSKQEAIDRWNTRQSNQPQMAEIYSTAYQESPMNEQKKEAAAQWWAECNKRIYDFPEKPARSIFEQGFVAGQAAQQSGPSTEVKRSRLYEIAEYLRGLGNDADASHVENCARDMVSMKHEIQTAMRGNKVSIDISTGDDDAVARAFATIIGKQPDIDGSVIWLCELDHYNDDAKPIDSEGGHHD